MCFNIYGFAVPQFITSDVTIQSNSTSCVILSWNVPKYPGAPIINYGGTVTFIFKVFNCLHFFNLLTCIHKTDYI